MKERYDVAIIGAGIGGLVCGCYLAKAGLKVIIVEQHDKPGGYCTSFYRKGYRFDVGVHYLGGIKKGILGKVLEELNIKYKIKFNQFDPTDKIMMPDNITYIRANPYDTIEEFKKTFPNEKENIEKFFKFIMQDNFLSIYSKIKKFDFQKVLDDFFNNNRLKATISALLGNIGISASKILASTAVVLFREFILDPGYYPEGGMQSFSNVLAEEFKKSGGELLLSKKVQQILTKDNEVRGILVDKDIVYSDFVVSNADANETFNDLLDIKATKESLLLDKLQPSASVFGLYLGVEMNLGEILDEFCNIWYSCTYDLEKYFYNLKKGIEDKELPFIMICFPSMHEEIAKCSGRSTIEAFFNAPYESKEFWQRWRDVLREKMLEKIKTFIPLSEGHIAVKVTATPLTLEKYTLNKNGAIYGWAPLAKQTISSILPQKTSIQGLLLAGHWCITGCGEGGIPGVASLGRNAARIILTNKGEKWQYPLFIL